MLRYANGQATRLPYRVARQLVAARLGQLPSTVDAMPADDFSDAMSLLPVSSMVNLAGGGGDE